MSSKVSTITRLPDRNLDVLRAVAVLCVLADHVIRIWYPAVGPVTVEQLGAFGVFIFFVHTSLVLMPSLERLQEYGLRGIRWIFAFYLRRGFRIYPLAWVAIILTLALRVPPFFFDRWGVINPFVMPSTRQIIGEALLSQNLLGVEDLLSPMWSLAIEIQMYVVLPFAFLLARYSMRWLVFAGLAGWMLSLLEWYIRYNPVDIPLLWRFTILQYVPCFMCGVLAYSIIHRRQNELTTSEAKPSAFPGKLPGWMLGIAIPVALAALVIANSIAGNDSWSWLGCLVLALALPAIREVPATLFTRIAKRIATYSYGIYLLHPIALWIAFALFQDQSLLAKWLIFVVLVIAMPIAAYHAIEKPCIDLGHKLLRGPLTRAATVGAP